AVVLSSPPVSTESFEKRLAAEVRDLRSRLTKIEQRPVQLEVVGLCEGCANNQIKIAALKTQLAAVTQRLEELDNQRTSIPPEITSAPPRPSCGRRLFVSPDSDANDAELTISPAFLTSTPACPRSLNHKKSTQLSDVPLRTMTAEREEQFYKECFQRGERRPTVYVASVFMALCPFEAYQSWTKQVNWTGTNGKAKLPKNLKDK
ncbi:zinc finger protein, partial [Clarias magur]